MYALKYCLLNVGNLMAFNDNTFDFEENPNGRMSFMSL